MGKQSRRKRQRSKRPSQTTVEETSSTLLQKLHHADSRTRHAALVALNATLLSPEQLESSSKRVVSSQILQATRERVMDDNLECAQVAAGCLANYVLFGNRHDKDELTAGWTLVFVERLKQCLQALSGSQQQSNQKLWLGLTVQCQHALCALIEMNPKALERMASDPLVLLRTMLHLLAFGQEQVQAASTRSDEECDYINNVATYAVRTLHSALDENIELLNAWMETSETREGEWTRVIECIGMTSLPLSARLHAAGCIVTARQLAILDDKALWADKFQQQVIESVLPLLIQTVELPAIFSALVDQYTQAHLLFQQQEADNAMEQTVIQSVSDKKEPARQIARRQKQLKVQQKKDGDEEMAEVTGTEAPSNPPDAQQLLEEAQKAWKAAVSPLQLALEVVANVTSIQPNLNADDEGMAMEEDDIAWGPEQEAQLMAGASHTGKDLPASPLDAALMEVLAQSGLGNRLVVLLKALCANIGDDKSLPPDVKDNIEELQSKCAACLGNCIGNLMSWPVSSDVWKELRSAAVLSTGKGNEGVFDTMAIAIRTRPEMRKQIQAQDLDFFMKQLTSSSLSDSIKGNIICILGLLCSAESHPQDVNEKVCGRLLSLLQSSSSAAVMSEVFNALMDMYGDDNHTQVFDALDVLGNFQRTLPRFKQRIQAEKTKMDEETVEQWRETALNASRFISYKKGQL